jgi:hypothetical protein
MSTRRPEDEIEGLAFEVVVVMGSQRSGNADVL